MVKKVLGFGLLFIIVFLAAMVFIPAGFSPSVSRGINASQYKLHQVISDINKFRLWDPKSITDTTVSFKYSTKDDSPCIEVLDSLDRIMATYKIEEANLGEVHISVNLSNVDPLLYKFTFSSNGTKTIVNWSMDFDGNLMMSLFGVEEQLENTFAKGLESLNTLVQE